MTTDCFNLITLYHSDAKLTEAFSAFKQNVLLSYFFPEPEHNSSREQSHWRKTHWGTPRDIYRADELESSLDRKTLSLLFLTADSPPLAAYDAAAARHGFYLNAEFRLPALRLCGRYHTFAYAEPRTAEAHSRALQYCRHRQVDGCSHYFKKAMNRLIDLPEGADLNYYYVCGDLCCDCNKHAFVRCGHSGLSYHAVKWSSRGIS